MKLARISKPLRSVQMRVMLGGDLNASLERYARYYEQVHGEPVDARALISEILRTFLEGDREFQSWSRSSGNGQRPAPQFLLIPRQHQGRNGDWLQRKVG